MKEPMQFDQETRQYFESLPKMIQENIMMSSPDITCKADLEQCVQHLMEQDSAANTQAGQMDSNQ